MCVRAYVCACVRVRMCVCVHMYACVCARTCAKKVQDTCELMTVVILSNPSSLMLQNQYTVNTQNIATCILLQVLTNQTILHSGL